MEKQKGTKEERVKERARERNELLARIQAATEAIDKLSRTNATEPTPAPIEPAAKAEPTVKQTPAPLPPPLPKIETTLPPLPVATEETLEEEEIASIKEVHAFVDELNLGPILPPEFEGLNRAQKLKVIRDLKQRVVDIVKTDAQTQYSEDLKGKSIFKSLRSSLNKEKNLKTFEKKVFEEFKNSEEGRNLIKQDLEILTKSVQGKDLHLSFGNKNILTHYLDSSKIENLTEKESIVFSKFNQKANLFVQLPYEWGQEKSGKHKKEYEKAKAEYEKARGEVLRAKSDRVFRNSVSKENYEEKGNAMLEMLEIDHAIQMEQLLNTHPEFEKTLNDFAENTNASGQLKDVRNFFNTMTGKNFTNRALMLGGFGARWGTKSLAVLAGGAAGTITAVAAPVVGGVIGGLRGRIRGKETLQERQLQARHGKKDENIEKAKMLDVAPLIAGLEKMANEVEKATTDEEKAKKLSKLAVVIEYSQDQIEKGQVNFGNTKSALANQFNFANNLNRALVLRETNKEKTNNELKERIDGLIKIGGEQAAGKISEAQKEFIKKQMYKGALVGAGFASAGYALRYIGEHLGWFGGHSTEAPALKAGTPANTSVGFIERAENWMKQFSGHKEIKAPGMHNTAGVFSVHAAPTPTHAMHGAIAIETHNTLEPISAHATPASLQSMHEATAVDNISSTEHAPATMQAMHGATVAETMKAHTSGAPHAINNFTNEGIKIENGHGAIRAIKDLQYQIAKQHPDGDYSKAPQAVQDFIKTDPTKEAIKLGLFDPSNPEGKESALIKAGSVLKLDEHGNILFGKPDASGNIPILEKYHGIMSDSDGSAKIQKLDLSGKVLTDNSLPKIPNIDDAKIDLNDSINNAELNEPYALETHAPSPSTTPEHTVLDETTRTPFDNQGHEKSIETAREEVLNKMKLRPGEYRTGTTEVITGADERTTGAEIRYTGDDVRFTGVPQNHFNYNNGLSLHDLSQEYPNNTFNLSGESLRQASSDAHKDIEFFWGEKSSTWNRLSGLTVKEVLEKTDKGPADKHLEDYLNLLKKYSGVRTKSGWFTQKKAGDYITEAWQKLAAGKGKVSMEKMEEIIAAKKNKY